MHENHRERLRERFLKEGLDSFEPHKALELLLFYAVPRRDTNELAHRLLGQFGSISGVFEAHPEELAAIEGVGRNSAVLLSMMAPLLRLYRKSGMAHGPVLDTCLAACAHTADLFAGRMIEAFYLLCLDPGSRLIREVLLQEGTVEEVSVHPRTVVEAALRCNASQVIFAHNHPKGDVNPSAADIACTKKFSEALSAIGITVADHIIVCGELTYSFSKEGRL
jgi:DNA repair protein RadC